MVPKMKPNLRSPQLYSFQVSKKYVSKEMAAKIHEKASPFVTWLKVINF